MNRRETPVLSRLLVHALLFNIFFLFVNSLQSQAAPQNHSLFTFAEFPIAAFLRSSAEAPAIHGNTVIWYDDRRGPTDVWGYDLLSGQQFSLAAYEHAQLLADISDEWIVYEDNRNGTWDIYATERATQTEIAVATGPTHQRYPQIWGNYIVYQDEGVNLAESDVYLFEISTRTTIPIAVTSGYQGHPDVSEQWAIWVDDHQGLLQLGAYQLTSQKVEFFHFDCFWCKPRLAGDDVVWSGGRTGDGDIYLYNLATRVETTLYAGAGNQVDPVISDTLIAWEDIATYGNSTIFVYVRASGSYFPLTLEPSRQIKPAVYGDTVVWQDNRHRKWEIYGWVWAGIVPETPTFVLPNPSNLRVGAYPAKQLRLEWEDQSHNEEGFVIQRAEGIFGTDWVDYVTVAANTTVYTDVATISDQSYWYRVRAFNAQGVSSYSNESYSTAIGDELPSADEQYLQLLINETRMDPAAFGISGRSPLNPVGWDVRLAYSARSHVQGMNNSDCCQGHADLIGRGPGERAEASGYPYSASENLFVGHPGKNGMEAVHQGFLDSADHRDNFLDPASKHAAIGFAPGQYGKYGAVAEVFSAGPAMAIIPPLPDGVAVPDTGTVDTQFTFLATFWNQTQQPPTTAQVVIDSVAYPMTLRSGQPGRGTYQYQRRLPLGDHTYHFEFEWTDTSGPAHGARLPEQGSFKGPHVRPFLPDLAVIDLYGDGFVAEHEGTIHVSVVNEGEISARDIVVHLYQGESDQEGVFLGSQVVPALAQGEYATLDFSWYPALAGEAVLSAWLDPEGTIFEANEVNNRYTANLFVRESGVIWYVDASVANPGDGRTPGTAFATIDTALQQALAGDTVQVAPGLYREHVGVPSGVHLAGSGFVSTTIQGSGAGTVLYAGDRSQVSGFTITGSGLAEWDAGIWIDPDHSVTIFNNYITANTKGITQPCFWGNCSGVITVTHNIINRNQRAGIDIHTPAAIVNNVLVSNQHGIHAERAGAQIRNNIVVSHWGTGISAGSSGVDLGYNNVWNNWLNYQSIADPGPGALQVDPLFVDPERSDYRLRPDSPCLNVGDPDPAYYDVDGSSNDLGAWGGPRQPDPEWPVMGAVSVELAAEVDKQVDARGEVTYRATLTGSGATVTELTVVVGMPAGATYISGSAATSHGTVQEEAELSFQIGILTSGEQVSLAYAVRTDQPIITDTILASPLTISWIGNSLTVINKATISGEATLLLQQLYLALILSEGSE